MNDNINNFLVELSKNNLLGAYECLDSSFSNDQEKSIIEKLKVICTSHFIRERQNKLGALLNLKKSGFNPQIVFDVGAQIGTPELYTAFPEAHHVFIEPVEECLPTLHEISKKLRLCTVLNCAISNVNEKKNLSLSATRQYSSIEKIMGSESRVIDVRTIDSIYESIGKVSSVLLKIDVDGIELDVLRGSKSTFDDDCVIIIEASIGEEYPRFHKIVEYLASYDFKVIDIVDALHRPSDWHLWQVDLVFAKSHSKLWGTRTFS